MKTSMKLLSLLLSLATLTGAFVACGGETETESKAPTDYTESDTSSHETDTETEAKTDGETDTAKQDGTDTERVTEGDTEDETFTEEDTTPRLEGEDAALIELADRLANTVNSYYPLPDRSTFVMENKNAVLHYDMETAGAKLVKSLTNAYGKAYLENTMDVYMRMENGSTYFASGSADNAVANIYRLGYYYYDNRIDRQSFSGGYKITAEKDLGHLKVKRFNMTEKVSVADGVLTVRVTNSKDPYICYEKLNFKAEDYNMLQITMRTDDQFMGSVGVYLMAGEYANSSTFVGVPSTSFKLKNDTEFHTYLVPLDTVAGYEGNVTTIRFDIDAFSGAIDGTFEIKELKAVKVESNGAPLEAAISRHFGFYSDKLHETLQVNTTAEITGVEAIGFYTKIAADTVAKLIVKDKNGTHDTLAGVDFASAEYIGFDIKGAGIFGYILPYDGKGGTLSVTLSDGFYVITEEKTPEGGKLIPSAKGERNGSDFYMGHRIYTDVKHDFTAFLKAAEEERHPLGAENFLIDEKASTHGKFLEYDSLRGIYSIEIDGVDGFNPHYLLHNNRQFNATFTVKGDGRQIYVMARLDGGALECAALLGGEGMLIPVPLEVGKNFSDATSRFDLDDARFSETILPMIAEEDGRTYSIINMYHKWGAYLLKQISFITYNAPYYHLSTGIHESNCIIPYYFTQDSSFLNVLPDHRAMSSPVWNTDPQHTYCGNHFFLQYTDAEGNYTASENTKDTVGSYGPIYADVTMDYVTRDGRIKASYNHMEMPQTDENRAYYEMSYEILEDITFSDFARDFSFYSATSRDPLGIYVKLGYLDENNESRVVASAKRGEEKLYVLGKECPYVSFFDMPDFYDSRGYSNLSFLIGDYEIVLGGKKVDPGFAVYNTYGKFSLSLNLGEVTLKKGDTIKLHAIVMPWGSQESDYSLEDKNVRDVRENSLLNPAKITPTANCEAIDTAFLPAVRTKDGKSAEFTISGGENNMAIRVYGFKMLTVPVVEEKIDGEWQTVKLCSAYTPDGMGFGYLYDGYMVYYDGDGTFSYAFVTTMTDGAPRTFRVTAAEEFDGFDEVILEEEDPFFFDAEKIEYRAKQNKKFMGVAVMEENGREFVRFNGTASEAYIALFADNSEATGDLLVIRYRIPTGKPNKIASFNFFTSTTSASATSADSYWASGMAITDGEWHVLVADLSSYGKEGFVPNADGTYTAKYLRFDIFNDPMDPATLFDLEYIALYDNINDVLLDNADLEEVMLVKNANEYEYVSTEGGATLDVMFTATQLHEKFTAQASKKVSRITLSADGEYVTVAGSSTEATVLLLHGNGNPTGQYVVLKYRIPEGNPDKLGYWNFFTSTVGSDPSAPDSFAGEGVQIIADGKWHVVVFDLAAREKETFAPAEDGSYTAKYFRFDVFNGAVSDGTSYDIAYIGLCDSLDDALAYNADMNEVTLSLNTTVQQIIDPATGEEITAE